MRGLAAGALCVAVLAACDQSSSTEPVDSGPQFSQHGGAGASSTGHFEVVFPTLVEKNSYSAILQPKGDVDGQFEVQAFTPDGKRVYSVHGETTCITVLPDGKTARMGGIITNAQNFPGIRPGMEAAWIVRDNGEGRNDPNDMASDIRFGFPEGSGRAQLNCDVGLRFVFLRPITEEGNIQVRP